MSLVLGIVVVAVPYWGYFAPQTRELLLYLYSKCALPLCIRDIPVWRRHNSKRSLGSSANCSGSYIYVQILVFTEVVKNWTDTGDQIAAKLSCWRIDIVTMCEFMWLLFTLYLNASIHVVKFSDFVARPTFQWEFWKTDKNSTSIHSFRSIRNIYHTVVNLRATDLDFRPPACLSTCLPACLPGCLHTHLHVCQSCCLRVLLFFACLAASVSFYFCLSCRLSTCLIIRPLPVLLPTCMFSAFPFAAWPPAAGLPACLSTCSHLPAGRSGCLSMCLSTGNGSTICIVIPAFLSFFVPVFVLGVFPIVINNSNS